MTDEHVTDRDTLHAAVTERLDRKFRVEGRISFPAVPSLLEVYLDRLAQMFVVIGKRFSDDELANLRALMQPRLEDGFRASAHTRMHVSWSSEPPPANGVDYKLWLEIKSMQDEYEHWAETKAPPLFGTHPDARAIALASKLGDPASAPILDLGAGTGRNTLPLARAGHRTYALEMTETFCRTIREAAAAEALPVTTVAANALASDFELASASFALVVCAEVTSHFRNLDELRLLFGRVARWLRPGGVFLVSVFVAIDGYTPTEIERELSQVVWSMVYTRAEIAAACEGLPLSLVADESVHTYEQANLPAHAWPPNGWFENWTRGFDLYGVSGGLPPMELRWLTFARR